MEFIDLGRQQKRIGEAIRLRTEAVFSHGHYIMGPEVKELESRLAEYAGSRHCLSCSSGSDALLMLLMAWEVGVNDAVFVPAFTFFATAEMPALLGATPIFVDIDPVTFNMDPACLARAVQAVRTQDASLHPLPPAALQAVPLRARCVIPVDLFGQAAGYEQILPLAEAEGLLVLEDGAQAFGGTWMGKRVCGLGCHGAATSFFPAKPLGCYGDGGAIFTDDDALAAELASVRVHGKGTDKYDNRRIGINGRLDTMQAAILLPKLDIFAEELERREQVAAWYARGLSGVGGVTVPQVAEGRTSVYAQYTIRVTQGRSDLASALKGQGIPTNIYYPKPLHVQGAFAEHGLAAGAFPVAAQSCDEVLSLPFHPYMERDEVERVCAVISDHCS